MYQIPTGTYVTRAALAVKGGSFRDQRHFAANAVLIRHPKGDLLVDAGFGRDVAAHVAMLPRMVRAPYETSGTAAEQLDATGYDRSRLLGVLVTHSHWDHVSGIGDLDVPVWINAQEREYAARTRTGRCSAGSPPVWRSTSTPSPARPTWASQRVSTCTVTDPSMIALAGGHTSGSVVVFVTPAGRQPVRLHR